MYTHYLFVLYFLFAALHSTEMIWWTVAAAIIYMGDLFLRGLYGLFPRKTTLLKAKDYDVVQVRVRKYLPFFHQCASVHLFSVCLLVFY